MAEWIKVIDLSVNQAAVDFVKLKATGVQGLILRVSHGQTIDSRYGGYYMAALAAGFAADDICHYTFINPKRGPAAACAAVTLTEIQRVVGHTNVGYMPDVENYRDQTPDKGQAPVFGAAFAAYIREHIATVHQLARGAVIFGYSNQAYWNGPVGNGQQWVGDDQLASEIEWLAARYPAYSDAQYAHYGYPGTPDTWPDWAFRAQPKGPLPPKGGKWLGWQFSAGFNKQGHAYGAGSTDLDLNIVQPEAWRRWTGKSADTQPTPLPHPEDDMSGTQYIANFDAGTHGPAYPDHDCSLWVLRDDDGTKRLLDDFERAARGWGQPAVQAKMSIVPCDDGTLAGIPDYVPAAPGGPGKPLKITLTGTAT